MKKKVFLSLLCSFLVLGLAGCGTNKQDDERRDRSDDSHESSNSTKTLVCKDEYEQDEDTTAIEEYTFVFTNKGEKLKSATEKDTMKLKDSTLSEYNIEQLKNRCDDMNTNYSGLSCKYVVKDNSHTSIVTMKVDYAKLDDESRDSIGEAGFLDIEDYDLEEVKEYMEDDGYNCEED